MSDSEPTNEAFVLAAVRPVHFQQIQELCKKVYPFSKPWSLEQLESHQAYFPDGQLVAVEKSTEQVVGLAFGLVIDWDDYSPQDSWKDFTSSGLFHNHNPRKGLTLYGAEVMVDPDKRRCGIGALLYEGRRKIVEEYRLKRIRAGARLRGYSKYQEQMTPEEYVRQVVEKKIHDPTLSFQLRQGFVVIDVAKDYLAHDPESLGYAAVIEWLNPATATGRDLERQRQSTEALLSGERFVPQFIPRELRRLVRKSTLLLGEIIRESEGEHFYRRVESYRRLVKATRTGEKKERLQQLLDRTSKEDTKSQRALAHAFALQLELVNVCEAAYRTWRLRQRTTLEGRSKTLNLTFVLTAHPTEARSPAVVDALSRFGSKLLDGVYRNFSFNELALKSLLRFLWQVPLAKTVSPTVLDEAEYINSLVFSDGLFDSLLEENPGYQLELRSWVGGDKDGHPGVDAKAMLGCLQSSRSHLVRVLAERLLRLSADLEQLGLLSVGRKGEIERLRRLRRDLLSMSTIALGDGGRIKAWTLKCEVFFRKASTFVGQHDDALLVRRVLERFPALVLPLELREDAGEIARNDTNAPIRGMLATLEAISGPLGATAYARGLVVSHCESADDIDNAYLLVARETKARTFPVIPLFESREALSGAKRILADWLGRKNNASRVKQFWKSTFEVMLGYSDSSKQIGVLPSRDLIRLAMKDIEAVLRTHRIRPLFFHGSGTSVARGGGSLQEQIAWWPDSAVAAPKLTVQGEMIQRMFSTPEILSSSCAHLAGEARRRRLRRRRQEESCPALERFSGAVESEYRGLWHRHDELMALLGATPYRYLDVLRMGSRPSKRPKHGNSLESLRAIPWVLCWTQSRALLPTWWGVGTAWKGLSVEDRTALKGHFTRSPFFSSFVKALGFTLAKVELDVWALYAETPEAKALMPRVREEFDGASAFLKEVTGQTENLWYRPWLQESIQLRSPHIHILNMLQILAMRSGDEALLRETIVGIASGMLTTG